jgi:hypothetical protein
VVSPPEMHDYLRTVIVAPMALPAAVIHLTLVCIFAICVVCCFARFTAALKNRTRR